MYRWFLDIKEDLPLCIVMGKKGGFPFIQPSEFFVNIDNRVHGRKKTSVTGSSFPSQGQYEHMKEVKAAQGIKLIAKDFEKAVAGLPMYVAKQNDEVEIYKVSVKCAQNISNVWVYPCTHVTEYFASI